MSRYHSYAMTRHQSRCHMGHFARMTLQLVSRRTAPISSTPNNGKSDSMIIKIVISRQLQRCSIKNDRCILRYCTNGSFFFFFLSLTCLFIGLIFIFIPFFWSFLCVFVCFILYCIYIVDIFLTSCLFVCLFVCLYADKSVRAKTSK